MLNNSNEGVNIHLPILNNSPLFECPENNDIQNNNVMKPLNYTNKDKINSEQSITFSTVNSEIVNRSTRTSISNNNSKKLNSSYSVNLVSNEKSKTE